MDPAEEQQQELEVLQSIYPDELEILSDTHFTITLKLETKSDRGHSVILDVTYTPTYPEEVPKLEVKTVSEDLPEPSDSEEDDDDKPQLVHLSEQIEFGKLDAVSLTKKVEEEAEINVGIPSIFALAALLKDEAEALFQAKLDAAQKKYEDELLAKEAEEQKKFLGTPVTKESYAEWRERFRKEMQIEKKDRQRFEKMHNGKMTGREIFEKGLAGNEDDKDVDDVTDSVSKVSVSG
ncbi:hypothetical protein CJJ07_003861 [Candidozyma auris]|nr:hypothetical protein CJJ07_003861 [[Candida] auris]QEL61086.1 hypothetical protein CJJ09_003223 [[Candida] auris]